MSRIEFEDGGEATERVPAPKMASGGRVLTVVLALLAVGALAYAWAGSYNRRLRSTVDANEPFNTPRANTVSFDFTEPSRKTDNRLVIPPPAPVTPPPIVQAPPVIDDGEARRRAEEEARRRAEEAKEQTRLRSGMLVVDNTPANGAGAGALGAGSNGAVRVQGPDEDPNRRFLANVSSTDVETARATRNERIDALIPQGTFIRGTLETAIQSDLPGMVRAITSENVYSFDGRRILIPKGSMLTGEYRSGLSRGQTRILIAWTRILRADGVSVALGSYGTDSLGRSGLPGDVDNHYVERFGSAILMSIVGGGSSFLAGLNSSGQSVIGAFGPTIQQQAQTQAQQTISQTMADLANQALKDSINIPPTIHVDQGTPIIVFVKRDLDFSQLYEDPVKEALNELRRAKNRSR